MFSDFLQKHQIKQKTIAVGVSGGADSLALVLMAQEELFPLGFKIVALTVDHGLRPTSQKEAAYVARVMKKHNIEHHILIWCGKKPNTGIEEAARLARYQLIEEWCQKNEIEVLMTAHHLYDQAETFFMRLERGSGLDGLCGMKEVTNYQNLKILRPLLHTEPEKLKKYLNRRHISWIEDESNEDLRLLRVKIRKFLPLFEEKTGISPLKIVQTMSRLQSSRFYFENTIEKLFKNNIKSYDGLAFKCQADFFLSLEEEISYRLLGLLIKKISQADYAPEAEKIFKLLAKMRQADFKSATLGHCQTIKKEGFFWFLPEKVQSTAYSKKKWAEYLNQNPIYQKQKLPLGLKKLLLTK